MLYSLVATTSRPANHCMARITAKEATNKRIPKTEITPTCPSSLRSKITTETTFDAGAKSNIDALSSRMTPMKMNDQAAISPERASGAVTSLSDDQPVGADDPARVFQLRVNALESRLGLGITDGHFFGQVGDEKNPDGSVKHQRRLGVGDEQPDRQDNARNHQRRQREESQVTRAPEEIAVGDVSDQRSPLRCRR